MAQRQRALETALQSLRGSTQCASNEWRYLCLFLGAPTDTEDDRETLLACAYYLYHAAAAHGTDFGEFARTLWRWLDETERRLTAAAATADVGPEKKRGLKLMLINKLAAAWQPHTDVDKRRFVGTMLLSVIMAGEALQSEVASGCAVSDAVDAFTEAYCVFAYEVASLSHVDTMLIYEWRICGMPGRSSCLPLVERATAEQRHQLLTAIFAALEHLLYGLRHNIQPCSEEERQACSALLSLMSALTASNSPIAADILTEQPLVTAERLRLLALVLGRPGRVWLSMDYASRTPAAADLLHPRMRETMWHQAQATVHPAARLLSAAVLNLLGLPACAKDFIQPPSMAQALMSVRPEALAGIGASAEVLADAGTVTALAEYVSWPMGALSAVHPLDPAAYGTDIEPTLYMAVAALVAAAQQPLAQPGASPRSATHAMAAAHACISVLNFAEIEAGSQNNDVYRNRSMDCVLLACGMLEANIAAGDAALPDLQKRGAAKSLVAAMRWLVEYAPHSSRPMRGFGEACKQLAALAAHSSAARAELSPGGPLEWQGLQQLLTRGVAKRQAGLLMRAMAPVAAAVKGSSSAADGQSEVPDAAEAQRAAQAAAAIKELLLDEDVAAEAKAKAATKSAKQARKRERKKAAAAAASADSGASEAAAVQSGVPVDGDAGPAASGNAAAAAAPAAAALSSEVQTGSPPRGDAAENGSAHTPAPQQQQGPQRGRTTDARSLPDWMLCPLTREVMRVPVQLADGHSFERAAVEDWLLTHDTSPVTGSKLEHTNLLSNHALRNIIAASAAAA